MTDVVTIHKPQTPPATSHDILELHEMFKKTNPSIEQQRIVNHMQHAFTETLNDAAKALTNNCIQMNNVAKKLNELDCTENIHNNNN